jgi:hypothetical protein
MILLDCKSNHGLVDIPLCQTQQYLGFRLYAYFFSRIFASESCPSLVSRYRPPCQGAYVLCPSPRGSGSQ